MKITVTNLIWILILNRKLVRIKIEINLKRIQIKKNEFKKKDLNKKNVYKLREIR